MKLRSEGKPAQKALKLTLNSIYVKLAQSVSAGGKFGPRDGHARKPTNHQTEYAGYAASARRGQIYRAATETPDSILGFATGGN